jgi:hypothetical protein
MFYGKSVKLAFNGKVLDAIVYHEHHGLHTHLGANKEPMVHVLYPDPAKEHLNLADPNLKTVIVHDCVHASHEFADEKTAEQYKRTMPVGRYHESRDPLEVIAEVAAAAAKRKAEAESKAKEAAEVKEPEKQPAATEVKETVN